MTVGVSGSLRPPLGASGRRRAKRTHRGRGIEWNQKGPPIEPDEQRFRVMWYPAQGEPRDVTDVVESVTWDDQTAILTGEIQLKDAADGVRPNITWGGQVVLQVSTNRGANFHEVWRMWVSGPQHDFESDEGSIKLQNALGLLAASDDNFGFTAGKHPVSRNGVGGGKAGGWLASEIAVAVAQRYRLPLGTIAKTKWRIQRQVAQDASPLDMIAKAYSTEKRHTGNRYVVSCYHGKLNILPVQVSRDLLALGPAALAAQISEEFSTDQNREFASAITVRTDAVDYKTRDIHGHPVLTIGRIVVQVQSSAMIQRFGFVHRNLYAHAAYSKDQVTQQGKRHLYIVRPKPQMTISHPGIASVRRGDAVKFVVADPDRHGVFVPKVLYVTEAQHTLSDTYNMTLTLAEINPFGKQPYDALTERRDATSFEKNRQSRHDLTLKPPKNRKGRNHRSKAGAALSGEGSGSIPR